MQEKQRFEENWRDAFDGAEMNPPDQVWSNIELSLAGAESAKMKKRVVFYQRVAAALLVVSTSLGVYVWNVNDEPAKIAKTESPTPVEEKSPAKTDDLPVAERTEGADENANTSRNETLTASLEANRAHNNKTAPASISDEEKTSNSISLVEAFTATVSSTTTLPNVANEGTASLPAGTESITQSRQHSSAFNSPKDSTTHPMTEEEALKVLQANMSAPEEKEEKKEKPREAFWLAMGAAAGSYNPNVNLNSSTPDALADKSEFIFAFANAEPGVSGQTTQRSLGAARSVGISLGKHVGNRWVFQSGLNYINQQIEYTSNVLAYTSANQAQLFTPEYSKDADPRMLAAVTTTSTYTINSVSELISIPVQAGYVIIDRKIAWQINTGVSSDIFMRNTLTDESGRAEKFTESAGEDSPYRSVNWSGLLNTEVSYRLAEHYRLALVPGFRYTFNSVLKEGTSTPLVLDLGFRFKYIFN